MGLLDLYHELQSLNFSNKKGIGESMKIVFSDEIFNTRNVNLKVKNLADSEKELVERVLRELEKYEFVKGLHDMKIYYQILTDPRNKENKSLYAKAYIPRYGNQIKRKLIGVHYGTLSNHPNGWSESDKQKARKELIDKGVKMLTSG